MPWHNGDVTTPPDEPRSARGLEPLGQAEASLLADERYFRRRGLPTLIEDYSATEDVLTRAWPWLGVLFAIQVTRSLATSWKPGLAAVVLVASVAAVLAMWIGGNRRAGRSLFSAPARVGWWSAAVFVIVPSLMRINSAVGVYPALRHVAFNVCVCAFVVGVIGWGLAQTLAWALLKILSDLWDQLVIVFRQTAAIFLFCFLIFFTQEFWQFVTFSSYRRIELLLQLLGAIAILTVLVGAPRFIASLQEALLEEDERLTRLQRSNLTILFIVRQLLQLALIFVVSAALFATVSVLTISSEMYKTWDLHPETIDTFVYDGETYLLTDSGLYIALLLALVATVNFAVATMSSSEGREIFLEGVEDEVGEVFRRRRRYLAKRKELASRGVSV